MKTQLEEKNKEVVLVTGGAGFIGSNIVEAMIELGYKVRVLDNYSTGKKENLAKAISRIELIEGDINDIEIAKEAVNGVDFILHLAAIPSVQRSVENPILSNQANVSGTLNMLKIAKEYKVKRFIYSSSSSVYGNTPVLPKIETMPARPMSPYAVSKYTGELYCKVFYDLYSLETISLRYFNVFGPKQDPNSPYAAVIPKFIKALINNEKPIIYGDGTQSRDFCFVDNVVAANILAVQCKETHGEAINIACGQKTSLNDLIAELNGLLRKNIVPEYSPSRPGDVKDSLADIKSAKELIGYEPRIFIKDGLRNTVEYFVGKQ